MMVQVVACEPFVTILDGGDCVAAVKGDKIMLPKQRADELIASGSVQLVTATAPAAPENKRVETAPENKAEAQPVAKKATARKRPPHTA